MRHVGVKCNACAQAACLTHITNRIGCVCEEAVFLLLPPFRRLEDNLTTDAPRHVFHLLWFDDSFFPQLQMKSPMFNLASGCCTDGGLIDSCLLTTK